MARGRRLTSFRIVQILARKPEKPVPVIMIIQWEDTMPTSRRTLLKTSAAAAAAFSLDWTRAQAQAETVRIGLIYDLTGPFAAGGSVASSIGAQIAIDLVNEKGGIGGKYKISPIAADSQSKPDVAINEANRLIDQEKIEFINGVYEC